MARHLNLRLLADNVADATFNSLTCGLVEKFETSVASPSSNLDVPILRPEVLSGLCAG